MKYLIALITCLTLSVGAEAKTKQITLTEDNTLVLNRVFTAKSTIELMEKATKLDASLPSGYPMYLFLYTPGGSIQAGLELYEFLKGLNRPVHTITLFAASMGFQTVQQLGDRYILNWGVLMSHYARGGSSGTMGGTDMPSTKKSIDGLWERRIDMMDKKTVERTEGKQTIESYRKAYMFDLWLNGPEAVEQGYADEVVIAKCSESLEETYNQTENFGFIKIHLVWSKCPLKTYPLKISASLATNKGFMELEDFIEKDGQFGDACFTKKDADKNSRSSYSYNYNSSYRSSRYSYDDYDTTPKVLSEKEEKLCVKDASITLESVKEKIQQRRQFHTRNLKDHIVYSY